MKTFVIEKELSGALHSLGVDALIRIKDHSGFFDSSPKKLMVMLSVASNCEVKISHVGIGSGIIISLANINSPFNSPTEERHSYEPFYREVIRVGLLIEKLILLIDQSANVEIDYPVKEEIIGRSISHCDDFIKEYYNDDSKERFSTIVPDKVSREVDSFLELVIPRQNYMMGTCYRIWGMKKAILRYGFNLEWKTPSEMNPDVIFD